MIDIEELHKRLDYYVNGPEDDCDRQAGEAPSPEDVLEMTSEIIRLRSADSNRIAEIRRLKEENETVKRLLRETSESVARHVRICPLAR